MTLRALLVMAKQPRPGRTKTRLIPPLSAQAAAELYTCLLLDTLQAVREAAAVLPLAPFIAFYPREAERYFQELAPDFQLIAQKGADLGARLAHVLAAVHELGYAQAAAINSDSPALPPAFLAQAFTELDDPRVDAVFGPSDDGGYYLIGWKRPYPRLVRAVTMSTPHVLADTLAVAGEARLHTVLLPGWYDIDDAADLQRMRENGHAGGHTRAFLSR